MTVLPVQVPDALIEEIAERAAQIATTRLADAQTTADDDGGYLPPARAAAYLGVSRKRIYDLTSARVLRPDGRDGRTPLYTRDTLARYAQDGLHRR